ncbi:MAG: TM2 domain-containing protein [Bacilli bacterium]|nr:TM2 domain-containing protein [Bacilli bacterium]
MSLFNNKEEHVNKIIYCILALFLGSIGIHKMYAGKTNIGLLYLLLCWTYIPTIISVFDFIAALCKTADVNGNILV